MIFFACLLFYIGFVNLMAYRVFADDKQRAIRKDQRTPEVTLLWWARIGGWFGAKYAQQKLRHKSYKEPFRSRLNIIGMVHSMTVVAIILTLLVVAVTPHGNPFMQVLQMVQDGWQVGPPAQESVLVSLRPPAGRP